jgi:hypothetical protein
MPEPEQPIVLTPWNFPRARLETDEARSDARGKNYTLTGSSTVRRNRERQLCKYRRVEPLHNKLCGLGLTVAQTRLLICCEELPA